MPKENKKKDPSPFTLRIKSKLFTRLESLATSSSKAAVARNYLELSHFVNVAPITNSASGVSILAPDSEPMVLFPKGFIRLMLGSLKPDAQYDFGDSLGKIFNTYCTIRNEVTQTKSDKIRYLQTLGWLEITEIQIRTSNSDGKDEIIKYYGIPSKNWPLYALHPFLYRIFHNKQYPPHWKIEEKKYFKMLKFHAKELNTAKRNTKTYPAFKDDAQMIEKYKKELGGHIENFEDECVYYIFEILKIEK